MLGRNTYILEKAIDAKWFLALKLIRRPLLLHSLTSDALISGIEKSKVLTQVGYNPHFSYPRLNHDAIAVALSALVQLRQQVCQEESNKSIVRLYTERLDEIILEQELMLATVNNDWLLFQNLNIKLYGPMNSKYVTELMTFLQTKTDYFQSVYPLSSINILPETQNDTIPLFSDAQQLIKGPDIVVDTNEVYTSEKICEAWNIALKTTMPEWRVVIDDQVTSMLVVHKTRTIKIPQNLKMNAVRMRKLFVHEIGTHVFRREQGKNNKLQLSSIGFAGNQVFEEGLAIVRSQLVGQKFYQFGGSDKYLTLSIALGSFDGLPKDFNQTFNILCGYFLNRLNRKRNNINNFIIAQNRAWNCTVRIFRGGNPALPGCCLLKDKIYHEGNRIVWDLIKTKPQYFNKVMLGKYNPKNELQREMVINNAL